MKLATRMRVVFDPRWHRTDKQGVFSVEHADGTRSFVATWDEQQPIDITDPLTTRPRSVERHASTFEAACHLQARGQEAERKRRRTHPESRPQRLGEGLMAGKWFEYWVRR